MNINKEPLILFLVFILSLLFFAIAATEAQAKWLEKDYQEIWCKGVTEHVLPGGARVDCIQDGYAIEVDYAKKWAESGFQALYYASQLDLEPGILLIIGDNDERYIARLFEAIQATNRKIKVWFIRRREE